nr:hypothetical protein [Tanacetum cinerariifolium]
MTAVDSHEETEGVNVNCTLEDTLQQTSTSKTQSDNAPIYDSDGSAEVHHYENCYNNDIFNNDIKMQYTDLQTELDHTKEKLENYIIKRKKNTLFFGIIGTKNVKNANMKRFRMIKLIMACNKRSNSCKLSWEISRGELFGNSGNTQCVSNDFSNTLIDFLSNGCMDLHGNTQRPTNYYFSISYNAVKVRHIHSMIHLEPEGFTQEQSIR